MVEKAAAGLTAGGLGAMVGSPADLTLIRMQSDSTLPLASRRNYKGVGDAMVRHVRGITVAHWSSTEGVDDVCNKLSGLNIDGRNDNYSYMYFCKPHLTPMPSRCNFTDNMFRVQVFSTVSRLRGHSHHRICCAAQQWFKSPVTSCKHHRRQLLQLLDNFAQC